MDIDKETYDLTTDHLNQQMQQIQKELKAIAPTISNLEKLIKNSLEKLQ